MPEPRWYKGDRQIKYSGLSRKLAETELQQACIAGLEEHEHFAVTSQHSVASLLLI